MTDSLLIDPSILGLHLAGDLADLTLYQTRKGKIVAFPRVKPAKPPSAAQEDQRLRFRVAVGQWHLLTEADQARYEEVVRVLSLCLTGLNLWIHFCLCPDDGVFATIQRQAGVQLHPTPRL